MNVVSECPPGHEKISKSNLLLIKTAPCNYSSIRSVTPDRQCAEPFAEQVLTPNNRSSGGFWGHRWLNMPQQKRRLADGVGLN